MASVAWGLVGAVGLMTVAWILSLLSRNASIVDRVWGAVFVLLAWTYVATADRVTARTVLAAVLVSVWGLRLTVHICRRDWGKGEDWRQRELRDRWPRAFPLVSLLSLFWLQAVAAVGVSVPLLAVTDAHQPRALGALDVAGVLVWAVGLGFEVVGDRQLARFRRDPGHHDRILDHGLWRYSRHPNYFGDAVQWWGLGILGLAAGPWWSVLGPLGMTIVLLRVTGVPAMDEHMRRTRGQAYDDYVARTSAFIPRRPRSLPRRDRDQVGGLLAG